MAILYAKLCLFKKKQQFTSRKVSVTFLNVGKHCTSAGQYIEIEAIIKGEKAYSAAFAKWLVWWS